MKDAPERIWASQADYNLFWRYHDELGGVEYIRADRIEELEAERDDYAFRLADANNTYSEMHVALLDAIDKLAKAVDALRESAKQHRVVAGRDLMGASAVAYNAARDAEAALAELKGKK